MKTVISTRLNSFKTRPELYDWKFGPGDPRDLIKRMKEAAGTGWYSINYPEHFPEGTAFDIKRYLKETGMRLSSVNLRYPTEFSLGAFTNPRIDLQNKAYQLTCEAADVCAELGGSDVVVWLGPDGFDYAFQMDYPAAWERELYWLEKTSDYCQERHLRLSIEYKPFEPRRNSLMGNFGLTMMAIQELDRKNLGITCDICHMMMAGEYPAALIAIALQKQRLFGLHLNDGYARADDGLAIGTVNFLQTLEIFKYLRNYDYEGFLYCDTFPINEDPVEEYKINIQRIHELQMLTGKLSTNELTQFTANQQGLAANQYIWKTMIGGIE